ncbi:unnamed protein product [Amoebophrya sp. A120]|nr:unnamed protein product [Amoebophrya sp. A120]|eukprot:GSA120T00012826001.1
MAALAQLMVSRLMVVAPAVIIFAPTAVGVVSLSSSTRRSTSSSTTPDRDVAAPTRHPRLEAERADRQPLLQSGEEVLTGATHQPSSASGQIVTDGALARQWRARETAEEVVVEDAANEQEHERNQNPTCFDSGGWLVSQPARDLLALLEIVEASIPDKHQCLFCQEDETEPELLARHKRSVLRKNRKSRGGVSSSSSRSSGGSVVRGQRDRKRDATRTSPGDTSLREQSARTAGGMFDSDDENETAEKSFCCLDEVSCPTEREDDAMTSVVFLPCQHRVHGCCLEDWIERNFFKFYSDEPSDRKNALWKEEQCKRVRVRLEDFVCTFRSDIKERSTPRTADELHATGETKATGSCSAEQPSTPQPLLVVDEKISDAKKPLTGATAHPSPTSSDTELGNISEECLFVSDLSAALYFSPPMQSNAVLQRRFMNASHSSLSCPICRQHVQSLVPILQEDISRVLEQVLSEDENADDHNAAGSRGLPLLTPDATARKDREAIAQKKHCRRRTAGRKRSGHTSSNTNDDAALCGLEEKLERLTLSPHRMLRVKQDIFEKLRTRDAKEDICAVNDQAKARKLGKQGRTARWVARGKPKNRKTNERDTREKSDSNYLGSERQRSCFARMQHCYLHCYLRCLQGRAAVANRARGVVRAARGTRVGRGLLTCMQNHEQGLRLVIAFVLITGISAGTFLRDGLHVHLSDAAADFFKQVGIALIFFDVCLFKPLARLATQLGLNQNRSADGGEEGQREEQQLKSFELRLVRDTIESGLQQLLEASKKSKEIDDEPCAHLPAPLDFEV